MSTTKLLAGIALGIAAGAIVGVLFAPDKGSKTRKKIAEKGEDILEGFKKQLSEQFDAANEKVDELLAKENHRVSHAKHQAKKAV